MFLKKTIITLIFIFFIQIVFCQKIVWQKTFGGEQSEYLEKIIPTPDYGFLVAGSTLSNSKGGLDYILMKINEQGDFEWEKTYGGAGNDMLNNACLTQDGGIILSGSSSSDIGGDKTGENIGFSDFWIIKLNAKGDVEWDKTIGGNNTDKLISVYQTKDKGYLIGGISDSDPIEIEGKLIGNKSEKSFGSFDFWIIKLNTKGDIEWEKTIGGNGYDYLVNCYEKEDGNFLIGGYSNSSISGNKTVKLKGEGEYWIIELNKNGDIISENNYGGDGNNELKAFTRTQDNGLLLGGRSNSIKSKDKKDDSHDYDYWLLKTNSKNSIEWQKTINIGKVDILLDAVEDKQGNILLSGYAQTENADDDKNKNGINNYVVIYLDNKGEELWRKNIGGNHTDILNNSALTRDGGIILAGTSDSDKGKDKSVATNGRNDFWILKINNEELKNQDNREEIEIYPNPTDQFVNILTNIEYKGSELQIYDMSGLLLQKLNIVNTTTPIDLKGYPQGVYIIKVVNNKGIYSKKIIKNSAK